MNELEVSLQTSQEAPIKNIVIMSDCYRFVEATSDSVSTIFRTAELKIQIQKLYNIPLFSR